GPRGRQGDETATGVALLCPSMHRGAGGHTPGRTADGSGFSCLRGSGRPRGGRPASQRPDLILVQLRVIARCTRASRSGKEYSLAITSSDGQMPGSLRIASSTSTVAALLALGNCT